MHFTHEFLESILNPYLSDSSLNSGRYIVALEFSFGRKHSSGSVDIRTIHIRILSMLLGYYDLGKHVDIPLHWMIVSVCAIH